ncbi:MAG: triose-phosphate isomerase [Candidatus Saccharimonas sp.]
MGKKLIIANWKMNLTIGEASLFVHKLDKLIGQHPGVEVVLAPTMLALQSVHLQVQHHHFNLAAQNFYWRDAGAYTGEVSATQLTGLVKYALVGHSERRHVFHERSGEIRHKVQAAYRNQIIPVLCVGETAGERANDETNDVIFDQLTGGLSNITSEEAAELVIAYEPVWAIGTGNNATPHDVARAVKAIRSHVSHLFGPETAKQVRVLYGGSVNLDNAKSYLSVQGIDGLLVGGASLDAHAFSEIIKKAQSSDTSPVKGKK